MNTSLIHRLSRIEGQLSALKTQLTEEHDCNDVLIRVKTMRRALQSFSGAYLQDHLKQCLQENTSLEALESDLSVVLQTLSNS